MQLPIPLLLILAATASPDVAPISPAAQTAKVFGEKDRMRADEILKQEVLTEADIKELRVMGTAILPMIDSVLAYPPGNANDKSEKAKKIHEAWMKKTKQLWGLMNSIDPDYCPPCGKG